jgi:hypothetical protein
MGIDRTELQSPAACDDDLECPICLGVMVDAVSTTCGHKFCRLCLKMSLKAKPECPMCRTACSTASLVSCHSVNMRVNSLTVCCERNCGWHGRRDLRQSHAKVCPVALEKEFRVTLHGHLGVSFVRLSENTGLFVGTVHEDGAAAKYNARVGRSARQIKPGCVLVEANGVRGDSRTLSAAIQDTSEHEGVDLVFQQYVEFSTVVNKNCKPWGLDVLYQERGVAFLQIEQVAPDGAVMEHNSRQMGEKLETRDRIVEVNGVRGTCRELLSTLQTSDTCEFRVLRLL